MIPQRFAQANVMMRPPPGMEASVEPVHAFHGAGRVVTAWRPTPEELVRLNLGEPLYLTILGQGMPPVALMVESPFEEISDPGAADRSG